MGGAGEYPDGCPLIPKAQLLEAATEQDLQPTTIEKDYALGWILHAVAQHPAASKWVFKGGTCLKKCFFNTYRFSEDLDFTIPVGEPYEFDAIVETLRDLARWAEAEVGIAFPEDGISPGGIREPSRQDVVSGQGVVCGATPDGATIASKGEVRPHPR